MKFLIRFYDNPQFWDIINAKLNYARITIHLKSIFLTYQAMEWQGTAATIFQQRMTHRNQARMIMEQD